MPFRRAHQTKLINPLISLRSKALYAYTKIRRKNINNSCHVAVKPLLKVTQPIISPLQYTAKRKANKKSIDFSCCCSLFGAFSSTLLFATTRRNFWWYPDFIPSTYAHFFRSRARIDEWVTDIVMKWIWSKKIFGFRGWSQQCTTQKLWNETFGWERLWGGENWVCGSW